MPKNDQNTTQIVHSTDLYDLALLAENDMDWMRTALFDVQQRVAYLKKDVTQRYPNTESMFHQVETVLDMHVYLAENRQQYHSDEAEKYELESEINKKVAIL